MFLKETGKLLENWINKKRLKDGEFYWERDRQTDRQKERKIQEIECHKAFVRIERSGKGINEWNVKPFECRWTRLVLFTFIYLDKDEMEKLWIH